MEDYLAMVTPWLDKARTALMWVTEKIAGAFDLDVTNTYLFVLIIVSLFLGKKIFNIFYSTSEGRWAYWLVIAGAIFLILKYL